MNIGLYADDCVVYNNIHSTNDQVLLNEAMERVVKWFETWQLSLNVKKCACLAVTRKRIPLELQYHIGEIGFQRVTEYRYLGVILSVDLKWSKVDYVTKHARSMLWYLKRTLKSSTTNTKIVAYKTQIRPILDYASVVWYPHLKSHIDKLEQV